MDHNQFEQENGNRRVVGPYIHHKKPQKKSHKGLIALICVIAVLAILGSAGAIYWTIFVKPPVADQADLPVQTDTPAQDDAPAEPEPEREPTEEELAQMQAVIEAQAEEIDVSGIAQKDGVFTVLVVGTDVSGTLTDTIVVATFDTNEKSVALLNIPRDTISTASDGETHKINSAYGRDGMDRLIVEIKNLLGFEVNRHIVVNFTAFVKIVDAIGGIEVDVPQDMYKNTGDMIIDLKAGRQKLDGEHALMLMRYRGYSNADIDRIGVQQQVYQAVIEQLATPATILRLPSLTSIIAQNVTTDMSVGELIWIGTNYVTMDPADVVTETLPHYTTYVNDISYVVPSERKLLNLINESFNPYLEEITRLNLAAVPEEKTEDEEETSRSRSGGAGESDADDQSVPGWVTGRDPDADAE